MTVQQVDIIFEIIEGKRFIIWPSVRETIDILHEKASVAASLSARVAEQDCEITVLKEKLNRLLATAGELELVKKHLANACNQRETLKGRVATLEESNANLEGRLKTVRDYVNREVN